MEDAAAHEGRVGDRELDERGRDAGDEQGPERGIAAAQRGTAAALTLGAALGAFMWAAGELAFAWIG